jgi:uncharacterized protein YxjI
MAAVQMLAKLSRQRPESHFLAYSINALYWYPLSIELTQKGILMSTRYKIRQKMFSIGDDFWIENQEGRRVFKVDGKALRLRKTLIFEDLNGNKLCQIQERWLPIRETMAIDGPDGEQIALVKKALIAPLRDRWSVNVNNAPDLTVQGNILDHEYTIKEGWNKVAEVSKRWLSLTDTYGVEIDSGQNDILILAVAIAIDMMAHDDDDKKPKRSKRTESR